MVREKLKLIQELVFLDHMLNSFARHGLFDLSVSVDGDLEVDCHHTIEDTGIVLGQAIAKAVGEKKSMQRYGSIILPMDETLILCAIDLSGRRILYLMLILQPIELETMIRKW